MREPRLRVGLGIALAGCAALFAAPAAAGPQQPPARTVACGEVLTESLRAANNLRDCPANGLVVGAPDITIDLGGHRIEGAAGAGGIGIDNSAGHDGVEIRNGIVQEFAEGVRLEGASGNTLALLRVLSNDGPGIHLVSSSNNVVKGNAVFGNGLGIRLDSASNANAFVANDASGNLDGFYVEESSENVFSGNTTAGNSAYGIENFGASGNTYKGNTASGNGIDGIILDDSSSDNVLKRNRAHANDLNGIEVAGGSGNLLVGNTAHENGVNGIASNTNALTLKKNKANGNGFLDGGPGDDVGLGILVPAGATSAGNKAAGNDDPSECQASDLGCHVP